MKLFSIIILSSLSGFIWTSLSLAQSEDIRDIKPPLDYPTNGWIFWVVFLFVLVGLCVGIWLWLKRRKPLGPNRLSKSASDIALDAINVLLSKGLFENGFYSRFFAEISLILRRYIEDRFHIRAAEMTTEEFLARARESKDLNQNYKDLLAKFLQFSDEVKFAKHTPTKEDMDKAVQTVKDFINETK